MTETPLWTAKKIASAVTGEVTGDWPVTGLSIDSRAIAPGMVFFALDGAESDGHHFVNEALAAGAHGAVVSRKIKNIAPDDPRLIHVRDTSAALERLGVAARQRMPGKVIAVTGSAGKTGTKEALKAALGRNAKTHASVKSYNNHVGVPLSLARMPESAEFGVFEIGMNRPGEIATLVQKVKPHLALITSVGPAHMAAFTALDQVADAKAEIFSGLEKDGIAVLNADDPYFPRLSAAAKNSGVRRIVTFGLEAENADIRPVRMAATEDCTCLTVRVFDRLLTYKIASPGRHWAMNSLAVIAAVAALDGDIGLAGLALSEIAPLPGRGERSCIPVKAGNGAATLLDESYNANPLSIRSALAVLSLAKTGKRGRRIAVLGDMLELGAHAQELHAGLAHIIRESRVDIFYAVGPLMSCLAENLADQLETHAFENNEALLNVLKDEIRAGDVISIKGANALDLKQVVAELKSRMERPPFARTGWTAPLAAAE